MFPQAKLVSLQLDQEAGRRNPAKEAPLTFGSFYVQQLLGGDNDERYGDNNDNDDNDNDDYYYYFCNHDSIVTMNFEILLGWDSARGVLYFSSRTSAAPFIQHVYRLKSVTNYMSIENTATLFSCFLCILCFICIFSISSNWGSMLANSQSHSYLLSLGLCILNSVFCINFTLFSISSNRSSMLASPTCLTCHLSSTCTWASALPSKVVIHDEMAFSVDLNKWCVRGRVGQQLAMNLINSFLCPFPGVISTAKRCS